ncbi:MAG: hypothetical protein H7A38_03675 [Chlamydiales bacterium]|nr:hypothetical protein [Chlamydiales bacterium]
MRIKSFLLAATFATSAVFADTGYEKEQKLCPNYGKNREGSMYTDGYGAFVYGDFLYWTAQVDGTDLAVRVKDPTQEVSTGSRKIERLDFNWDPAFRVGLGYYIDCMDWSLALEWTRLRTDTNKTVRPTEDSKIYSLWGRLGVNSDLIDKQMEGKWSLDYDTLDLLASPGYFRYRQFAFRPVTGLRGGWIDWDYTVVQTSLASQTDTRVRTIHNKNHYNAIGTVGGLQTKMFLGMGFQIYSDLLASILYGKLSIDQTTDTTSTDRNFSMNEHDSYWRVRPNLHMKLGLEWERFFSSNSMRLNLHIGYEYLVWFNQNELYRYRDEVANESFVTTTPEPLEQRGDLGVNGFTVGGRFEF